jgi:hypothetical protein
MMVGACVSTRAAKSAFAAGTSSSTSPCTTITGHTISLHPPGLHRPELGLEGINSASDRASGSGISQVISGQRAMA